MPEEHGVASSILASGTHRKSGHRVLYSPPRRPETYGGYGVMAAQEFVELLEWVRIPLATQREKRKPFLEWRPKNGLIYSISSSLSPRENRSSANAPMKQSMAPRTIDVISAWYTPIPATKSPPMTITMNDTEESRIVYPPFKERVSAEYQSAVLCQGTVMLFSFRAQESANESFYFYKARLSLWQANGLFPLCLRSRASMSPLLLCCTQS